MTHRAKRILIVEDEGVVAADLKRTLEDSGFEVTGVAASAEDAIQEASVSSPDLVLMDIRIQGGLDGIEAAALLDHRFGLPTVYLTAHGDQETIERAKQTHPLGFLLKPFKQAELVNAIDFAFEKARAERREREQQHAALRESEERNRFLADLLERADQPFAVRYLDGTLGFVNPAFERLTGYSRDELRGFDWTSALIPPEWRDTERANLEELHRSGRPVRYENEYLRKDGTRVPIGLLVHLANDAQGRPHHYYAFLTDLTERKRAEERLTRMTAELSRSNQELEQFAYVASHDLQEPLRAVTGYLGLIEQQYREQLDDKGRHYITEAVQGAARMHGLITALLALSRVGSQGQAFAPADLSAVLDEALRSLHPSVQETGAKITRDPLPTLRVDARQMTQLFQNLVGNALKFHGEQPPEIHISAQAQPGQWVVAVRDNGIGIEPQYFERIFLIFQRLHTRRHYPGTGVGLAICKKIVEWHGGRIWVESQAGRGSTFYFTLPTRETQ